MNRIQEFEGLRGILAWWVVLSHVLVYAGFAVPASSVLRYLWYGEIPVDIFIILSGFVIFYLLSEKREPYRAFIVRRFFRIYPVFLLFLTAALLLNSVHRAEIAALPWSGDPWYKQYLADLGVISAHLRTHLGLHLALLHGVPPDRLLYHSCLAILPPAWSISLEWQFYLLAPALFYLDRRRRGGAVLVALLCMVAPALFARVGHYPLPSFLPMRLPQFLIGMLCCRVWVRTGADAARYAALAKYLWIVPVVAFWFVPDRALVIWSVVFCAALARRLGSEDRASVLLSSALGSRPCAFLGRVSYSTYLCHMPVLWLLMLFLIHTHGSPITKLGMLAGLSALGVPAILVCSYVSYRLVELPGIRLGSELVRRTFYSPSPAAGQNQPVALGLAALSGD